VEKASAGMFPGQSVEEVKEQGKYIPSVWRKTFVRRFASFGKVK